MRSPSPTGTTASPGAGPGLAWGAEAAGSAVLAVALLVVVAAQRQPRLGARRRLRHRPAVGLADLVGVLSVGAPTVAEVVLGLAVTLLLLVWPVALHQLGRWVAVLLAAGGRVGVGGPGAQRLGHPPLAHRAHPGTLGLLVGQLLALSQPLGQPRRWPIRVPAAAGGAAVGHHLPQRAAPPLAPGRSGRWVAAACSHQAAARSARSSARPAPAAPVDYEAGRPAARPARPTGRLSR